MSGRLLASGRRVAQAEVRRFVRIVEQQQEYVGATDAMEMALQDFLDRRIVHKKAQRRASPSREKGETK